ncbi:hypothetical protein AVEN_275478-1, partial [Araneus ventricosus]
GNLSVAPFNYYLLHKWTGGCTIGGQLTVLDRGLWFSSVLPSALIGLVAVLMTRGQISSLLSMISQRALPRDTRYH